MKRFLGVFISIAMIATSFAACGNAEPTVPESGDTTGDTASEFADAPNLTFALGHVMSEDSTHQDNALYIQKAVAEATDGTVNIEIYPSSSLGSEIQMVEGLQAGTVDMVTAGPSTLQNFIPEFGIYDLPYLFNGYEHANAVWESEIGANLEKKLNDMGIVVLATGDFGFRNLTNNVRPVYTPDDVKGLKIRVMQSEIPLAIWNKFGAETISMAINEVFSALQTGVVDGQENPITAIKSNGFHEVQKYLSTTEHQYTFLLFLMSKSAYDRMTPAQQAAFSEAVSGVSAVSVESMATRNAKDLETMKAAGMEVNDVDKDAFKAAAQSVLEQYYDVYGKDVIQSIQNDF